MSPVTRFRVWIGTVVAALAAPVWTRAGVGGDWAEVLAAAWGVGALTAVIVLLLTTPAGAIKLKRRNSFVTLAAGGVWLGIAGGAPWWGVAALGAAPLLAGALDASGGDRDGRPSPWIAAPVLWNPLLWLRVLRPEMDAGLHDTTAWAVFVLWGATALLIARATGTGSTGPRSPAGASALACWALAGAATLHALWPN